MSIWLPATVYQEPVSELRDWQVFRVKIKALPDETLHLVGLVDGEGRVCSPLKSYNAKKRTAVTRSGRVYILRGPRAKHTKPDAVYVWNTWKHHNLVERCREVLRLRSFDNRPSGRGLIVDNKHKVLA